MSAPSTDAKIVGAINHALDSRQADIESFIRLCESPIERLFAAQFVNLGEFENNVDGIETPGWIYRGPGYKWVIVPQFEELVDEQMCRLDFAIFCHTAWVAVECDGHDFHEKTKDQAKRDKRRDRALVGNGWNVLRFTGSELWENAGECARQALHVALVRGGVLSR